MTAPQQDQPSPPQGVPLVGDVLRRMEEAIRDVVPDDEFVTHFDLLVETRSGPEARTIRFRRYSPPGSDPLLSLGLLSAAKARLTRKLGLSD